MDSSALNEISRNNDNFPTWPRFDEEEIDKVSELLRSGNVNYWTGQEGKKLEKEFAKYFGTPHAVAVMNGSVALELALEMMGVSQGDEVVVSPRTFIASVSSIILRGATPVFADVDPVTQNITAESVRSVLTSRTKAIIAVHLAGWPCEMDKLRSIADAFNLKIIEDCAQAHGAAYRDIRVGSFGDAATFSFCQDKIMTTGGEGGMLLLNDEELWKRAWAYKDHGKSFDAVYRKAHRPGFRWLHESFGTNWRMTEMQAAIGRIQLKKLSEWVEIRRSYAAALTERFRSIPGLRVTEPPAYIRHAYYKYYTFIDPNTLRTNQSRDRIMQEISDEDVPCMSGSCSEVYLERAFENTNFRPSNRLPIARELGETSLMFLVHPTLSQREIERTCDVVSKVMSIAVKL